MLFQPRQIKPIAALIIKAELCFGKLDLHLVPLPADNNGMNYHQVQGS